MIILRRPFIFIVILAALLLVLPACNRGNGPQAPVDAADKPAASTPGPGQTTAPDPSAAALAEQIYQSGFSGDTDRRQENAEIWAKLWLEYTYPDRGLTGVQARYLSSSSHGELSDQFDISPAVCSLQFAAQNPVPGAVRLEGGNYELKIIVVAVADDQTMTLCGFLNPGEFDEYDALAQVYEVVARDPRFAGKLKPYPEFRLPPEVTAIDMRRITGSTNLNSSHLLPGGIVASVLVTRTEQEELEVSLYDLTQDKLLGSKQLGSFAGYNSRVEDGKLMLQTFLDGSPVPEIIRIDSSLNITREPYAPAKAFARVSPDGTRIAYTDKGNLYVADSQGEKPPQLLIAGNDSPETNRDYYYPYCWAGDNMIVYGRGGYEWSNGCGLYDLAAGRNIPLDQAGPNATPDAFGNGKLFTVTGDMGAPYDPYVIDLNDPALSARKVFADKDFLQEIGYAVHAVSPDGSTIVLLHREEPEGFRFALYLCSSIDGSVLKHYEFETVFNSPQYPEFADDGRLAVFSERYALSAKYMYLMKLD